MEVVEPIKAKLVIEGLLECRDKDGVLLKTIPFRGVAEAPFNTQTEEVPHDDQRRQ